MAASCISSVMGNLGLKLSNCPYMELSVMVFASCFSGMSDSILGPSLEDLRCIYSVSVQTISILLPLYSGLKTAGCMLYAPLHTQVNTYTLMIVCVIVISGLGLAIPLCSSFWLAAAATSGTGLAGGVLITAATAKTGDLSKGSALPFHMMALSLCIGNVLGALVVSPFLSDTVRHGNTSVTQDLDVTSFECADFESNVAYAYLCFASFGTILAVLLAILRVCLDEKFEQVSDKTILECSAKVEIIFISFLTFFIFVVGATHIVYGSFLLLFGTRSTLKISEKIMAIMTSSYYAVTTFGRLSGVLLSLVISQLWILIVCVVGVLATSLFLVCAAESGLVFLWTGSHVLGLFYAPLFASVIAWSVEKTRLNNTVYTILTFADYAGMSIIGLVFGQLMTAFGPRMLHYSSTAFGLIQMLLFLCLFCFAKLIQNHKKEKYNVSGGF